MQLIPFLYLILIPILIVLSVVYANNLKGFTYKSLLQVMNILLLIHALYQIRVVIGIVQFFRSINSDQPVNQFWFNYIDESVIKMIIAILLPLFFAFPLFRKSLWFSLGVMVYYLNETALPDLYLFDWMIKFAHFLSWFSFVYALFWLKKWLPVNKI